MAQKKIIANNKKAFHDYFIEETYEAGLVLFGTEIKSIRQGGASLRDSHAEITDKGEVFVLGVNISPYEQGNRYNQDPVRPKKLLLNKREIRKLQSSVSQKGMTLVPTKLYLNEKGLAKIELGVARGKKLYDKREDIAKRDAARNMDRKIKGA